MEVYVFSTDHAGEFPPYLMVRDQDSARPGHPDGKSWVPWKPLKLERQKVGLPALPVATGIESDGFYITDKIEPDLSERSAQ